MLAKLHTFALVGIDAVPVEVEVDVSTGALPKVILVGLPESAVKESVHRVERALTNSGYSQPHKRIVINLAPADLPKQAASFDLPITLGILAGSGQISQQQFEEYAVVGELALDGSTRTTKGTLSMAMAAAQQKGLRGLILPAVNAAEAAVVEGIDVIGVSSLAQAVGFMGGNLDIEPAPARFPDWFREFSRYDVDFADVRGQEMAKRAITVAAAGMHNILMIGPPGSGKTMVAKRVSTILPDLTPAESLETTRIYNAMGLLPSGQPLLATRPFRSPHHTISDAGLVGGGSIPMPGEISFSHNGVLFLDELPEFNRRTLEVLRQPLEDGNVTINRAMNSTRFPADFMLIAALNPCPCGFRNDPRRECHCSVPQIERYMSKISGPLVDRIDIHLEVPAVPYKELSSNVPGTSSAQMREQVIRARELQQRRFSGTPIRSNARMSSRQLRQFCVLNEECSQILRLGVQELGLSARAHDKVLRVARTIADLEGSPSIEAHHVHEAVNYRVLDRSMWT